MSGAINGYGDGKGKLCLSCKHSAQPMHPTTPKSDIELLLERSASLKDSWFAEGSHNHIAYKDFLEITSPLKDQMIRTLSEALEKITRTCFQPDHRDGIKGTHWDMTQAAREALTEASRLAREALGKE